MERKTHANPGDIQTLAKKQNDWISFSKNELLLILGYFFFGVAFANYEPYAPFWLDQLFQEDLYVVIGFAVVIPRIMTMIGSTFWGVLSDRFGTKKFVISGLVMFLAMFFSLIFAQSTTFFLVVVLIGYFFGSATQSANYYAFATKVLDKPREIVLAKLTITISFAFIVFSPIVSVIKNNSSYFKTIQLVIAVCAILFAIAFVAFVKPPEKAREKEEAVSTQIGTIKQKRKLDLTLYPSLFIVILLLAFFIQATSSFWAYTSVYYYYPELGINSIFYAVLISLKTTLAIPLAVLLGRVKRKNIASIIIVAVVSYFSGVYLVMTFFPTNWILLTVIYSIPLFPAYNVLLYGLLTNYSKEKQRATAYGLFNSLGTFGYISGILLLGLVADKFPLQGLYSMFPTSLIIAIITSIVALILYFLIRKNLRQVTLKKEIQQSQIEVTTE